MYLPKSDIYKNLKTLNYPVAQTSQNIFNEFPNITFEILDNNVFLFLDNSIAYQEMSVKIDIWSESSVEASKILSQVEEIMRKDGYKLGFSGDVPNMDKSIFHISTRFTKKI